MSTTEIKEALAERDQAIEGQLSKLSEKQMELGDRVIELEQREACDPMHNHDPRSKHSVRNVLKALSDPQGKVDGFEAEWHQEFASKSGLKTPPGAIWVPLSTKAVDYNSESPTSGGSNLIETELRSNAFIDILRQQSVIMGLNPTVVNGQGDLDIPKATQGSTAYWVDGDGTAITESEQVYTTVQLRPTFCTGYAKYNYRVALQTGGDIDNIIRRDLMAQIAAEVDNQAINGDGASSKITGILNTSGIQSTSWATSPAAVTWDDVLALEKMLIDEKALTGQNLHYLVDPATYKDMKGTTKVSSDAGSGFIIDFESGRAMLNGYPVHVTTHMPANTMVFGNFSELLVGQWGAVALASDPYTDFAKGTVGVRAMYPIDMAVRHAVSFAKSSA